MFKIIITFFLFQFNLNSQESVFLETNDGWKIHAKYLKPKKENLPVLLLVHSQKSNYTEWKKWFSEIERYGYGWMALELRGHGISTYKTDGSTQTFSSFSVSGFDNDYNKMIRDIDAAVIYLSSTGVKESDIIIIGVNLGANLAIKYSAINKNIFACVAINPSTNINDILTVNPLRLYGQRPILFVTAQNYKKRMQEVMLLYTIAKKTTGQENAFIIIEYSIKSAEDVLKSTIYKILNWVKNPKLPPVVEPEKISVSSDTFSITSSSPSYIILPDSED
ncbi:MAG: acetylxylan esterase [Elusimicrobiota bacterium]